MLKIRVNSDVCPMTLCLLFQLALKITNVNQGLNAISMDQALCLEIVVYEQIDRERMSEKEREVKDRERERKRGRGRERDSEIEVERNRKENRERVQERTIEMDSENNRENR